MKETAFEKVAKFVQETSYEDLPPKLIDIIKTAFTDYVGVSVAGARHKNVTAMIKYAKLNSKKREASVFCYGFKSSVQLVAMINAVSSHSLDFDDVSLSTIGHPSVVIAPVCFALSENLNLGGKDMILAYALASEVMHKLALCTMPEVSQNGWHTTSVFGVFGAVVAAAVLKRSSKSEIISALGIAASKASGVRANFGTSVKAYYAGMACFNGIDSLLLAGCGLSSSPYSFEGVDGFMQTFGGIYEGEVDLKFGDTWDLLQNGLVFKRYPSCSGAHPAIDLALEMGPKYGLNFRDIKRIDVGCSLLAPKELNCEFPTDALQAKFSMRYAIASALFYGGAGLGEYTNEKVADPQIQEFMRKIYVSVDNEFKRLGFIGTSPVKIKITLENGEILNGKCLLAKGNPQNPLSTDEMASKFYECTKDLRENKRLFETLNELEKCENLEEILNLIS